MLDKWRTDDLPISPLATVFTPKSTEGRFARANKPTHLNQSQACVSQACRQHNVYFKEQPFCHKPHTLRIFLI